MEIQCVIVFFSLGVENHASTCTTYNINHFVGPLKPINNMVVKGYSGLIKVIVEGAVKCKI